MTVKVVTARKHGFFHIVAQGIDGQQYTLKRSFKRDDPKQMSTVRQIREKGEINLHYWNIGELDY